MYCALADLFAFGLPRGALRNPGRPADFASAADDTITLDVHGFVLDDIVTFRAESGGQLPAPLAPNTDYFAIPVSESRFSVAATQGGAAIDLTTDGARIVVIATINFNAAIEFATEIINDQIPAHLVPLVAPYPRLVVMTCAELAIGKLMNGSESKSLSDMVDEAVKRIARWATGQQLRGDNADAQTPANIAVSGGPEPIPRTSSGSSSGSCDRNDWRRFGGL